MPAGGEQPLRALALEPEAFLTAITGNSVSNAAAGALVDRRLTANAQTGADADSGPKA